MQSDENSLVTTEIDLHERILHTFPSLSPVSKTLSLFNKTTRTPYELVQEAAQLVSMLSEKYSTDHSLWLTIGSVLYMISHGSRDGITVWIVFSKRTCVFTEKDCINAWIDMKPSHHTMHTLYYHVKKDNMIAYNTYKTNVGRTTFKQLLLASSLELTETDWAEIMYILYKDEFFYDKHWYTGELFQWTMIPECIDLIKYIPNLRMYLNEEIKNRNMVISKTNKERMDVEERDKSDENDMIIKELEEVTRTLQEKVDQLLESRKQLGRSGFKNNIIKECKLTFYDKTMLQSVTMSRKKSECNLHNEVEYDHLLVNHPINKSKSSYSLLESFIIYIVNEDTEYNDDIILLSSNELLKKSVEFTNKYNINHTFTLHSIFKNPELKKITGITLGVRCTKKDSITNKIIDNNKSKFNKTEIKKYFCI